MQDLIGNNGSFANVPVIPVNLINASEIAMIIPEGFEDVMSYQIKKDGVHITLVNDEYQDNEIIIPASVYNPSGNLVEFPRFLIERTIVQGKEIDYFTDESDRYILNQNELLYVVLQHRFLQFLGRANVYSNLLKQDVSAVASFMSHVPSIAYNSIAKNHNSYIIMNVYGQDGGFKQGRTLGDIIRSKRYLPDSEGWEKLRGSLEVQCSSESGASEVGKLILSPYSKGSLYRSVGHKIYFNTELNIYMMKSLFKSAQNITARNKTHVTANAFEIYDFKPTSNFIEDWAYDPKAPTSPPVLSGYLPKDACYVRAISVIRPINTETGQYLFGEVEASPDFYDTYVWEDQKVIDTFDRMVLPKDGSVVYAEPAYELDQTIGKGFEVSKYKPITIGYREEGSVDVPIVIHNVKAVKYVKDKLLGGPNGKSRVTIRVARKAGNARCDSNTGFKGVTKGKPNLGKIVFEDGTELKPMLAFGMNSFKAKHNSIELARAALAVDMKCYKPKHWSGKLNSFDEGEINTASQSLPAYVYYDEFGNKHENVEIGVIYYRYTELGETFKSYKKQSFSHEAGRNLFHNENNDLFHFLWDNYVDHDMKDALVELQKTLTSSDAYEGDKDLPYYTPAMIQAIPKKGQEPLFDLEKDLFTSLISNFKSSSKILKDEFNPKGFFLDFRAQRGPLIRVPSAKTLRLFENELETGEWRYHRAFLSLSKMIRFVMYKRLNYVFLKPGEKHRDTHSYRYLRDIKGIIFTSDDSKEMNVTALSRPMVPGFAMKQSVEVLLPPGTALIMCDKAYKKALIECYGEEDYELQHLMYGFHGLHCRAPFLWRTQLCKVRIWSAQDFREYLWATHNIILDNYLLSEENADIIFFSKTELGNSHSDVDGDHSSAIAPQGIEGQKIMRNFVLSDVCEEEKAWTAKYLAKEAGANDDLIDPKTGALNRKPYALYDVPLQEYVLNRETVNSYSTYFFQALLAKQNIGSSTNDGWVFAMILEAYRAYARENGYEYITEDGQVIPMIRLNNEKFFKYHFTYIRGLQDFVVTGVKHNDSGSADFESLFLRNIADEGNAKTVMSILQGALELDAKSASDILRIVTWAEYSGVRVACSLFLRLYNKGTESSKESDLALLEKYEAFIQKNTYFGMLLKPIYDVIFENKHNKEITEEKLAQEQEEIFKSLGIQV